MKKGSKGKGGNVNWFKEQEKKKIMSSGKKESPPKAESGYRQVDDAPILKVQMNSKNEEKHFEDSFAFAQKMSDPNSDEIMTIHLNMDDELVFNMEHDEEFESLWRERKLMLLVSFPRNWKSAHMEAYDDEDDELVELESEMDRFDYLYETGMAIYEK